MATIDLQQVEKRFGEFQAVEPMDLTIQDGEFVALLGPSGCGKTTTLRMIAGLETVTSGKILLNGQDVTDLRGRERDIAFVFQLFALYPHMNVRQNISFTLQAQGESKETIKERVDQVVKMLEIEPLLSLRPKSLSGGDRQRVALARALVRRPAAFLMDEPLGALDADFRDTMRAEIKRLHLAQHATTVYVTHDQVEAMAMGDRIVVMSAAVVQQVGTPAEVYHDPVNLFVARFIGSPGMNLLQGRYEEGVIHLPGDNQYRVPDMWRGSLENALSGSDIIVGFRPEAVKADNLQEGQIKAEVYTDDLHGSFTMLHLALDSDDLIVHARAGREDMFEIGDTVHFDLNPELVRFFDPHTENAITRESNSP